MKNFKRIVGLLLCLAMVLSFVPASVVSAAESTGASTQNLVKSDVLEKINITGTAVGACSSGTTNSSDITNLTWYNVTEAAAGRVWDKHLKVTDGSTTTDCTFNVGDKERGDFYIDLTKKNSEGVSADYLKLYYGAGSDNAAVSSVSITLVLANGTKVEESFNPGWSSTTAGDPVEWEFDETYTIDGIYVYAPNGGKVSFGEIELYQYAYVNNLATAQINGVDLSQYKIVYSASDLDYAKTAAEYIQKQILLKTGRNVEVVTDATAESTYEIQVGNVNRTYAKSISAPTEKAMKFTFASNGTKIAMKADYFIIAGAAYYFVDTYIKDTDFDVTANTGAIITNTITKEAKNYIFMIGDGMGEMHTRLFEKYGAAPTSGTYGFGDGEDIFYGYYLPYLGWQKTANISGAITDSAAAGTALATGYKTINGYVGKDQYLNDVKNLSELAMELGKSVAVISTEGCDGATPAAFSSHADGRYNDEEIYADHANFGGLLVNGYERYNEYDADEFETWEPLYLSALNSVSSDPDGFFIMYEEAEIDKVSHRLNYTSSAGYTGDTDMEVLFRTVYRFNQAIANFMEYALYNPDTAVLITADHETSGLNSNFKPTEQNPVNEQEGGSVWNHSLKDVPVFAYGDGMNIFNAGRNEAYENASIGRTFAHLMTDGNADDFGNPAYPIIGSGESGEVDGGQNYYTELPDDATKVTVDVPSFGYYNGDTNGDIIEYYDSNNPPSKLIDGIYNEKGNRTISGYYTYEEIANGEKVPVILFEFDEPTNIAGIKLAGYAYNYYNMEDFDIEVYSHDGYSTSWYTAATVRDAFTAGTTEEQITTPMEIGFSVIREATKLRIVVKSITNMSSQADGSDGDEELATGSYFRVKEIEVYETDYTTVDPEISDPTEPTEPTQPTQATEPVATKPATVGKLDLTDCDVYLGSMEEDSGKDFAERTWLKDGTTVLTDNDRSNEEHVRMWPGYRADCYVEIGTAVFATQLQIHYSGYENDSDSRMDSDVPSLTVTLYLSDGSTETKEFADLDWEGKESGSVTWDFDETYQVAGIYVWSPDTPDDAFTHFSLAEIELYGTQAGGETPEPTEPTEPTTPTTPVATDPDALPDVVLKPVTNVPTPIVGYYSDNNTNGNITEYLNEDTNKGKAPAVLVDGKTGSSADYNWTGYYRYDDVASGAKIPVYLFEFDDPVAFTGVKIDGYKAMYYGIEDFTVQVYIEGKGWVTATTVADSFGAQTQEEYADPITYPFAEPLYGTKIRILVDKLWNMYDWRYDDEESFNLEYEASIRLREITLMEDPDYVPPVDAGNTLMPPSSLNTEFTDTTITAVAPPSTEYPEAEIRYAVYFDGQLVAANSTGIFTGLQPNTRYTVYAKYIGDGEIWQNSSSISNTTATDKLKLPTPNVEVDLTSTSITATADEIEGGELQFRLLDANHVAIGEWQSSGNFTGLTPNTTYYIQARYNGDTNHYDSEVRTLEVETGKILLNKPTLTVSGTTYNTITLNALPTVTGGTAEYSYRVEGGEWIVASSNVITGLTPNTTYELRARYVATDDSYNTSLYSEVVTATTMKAPLPAPNVSATVISDSEITATANTNDNGTLMFSVDGIKWFEADANGSYPFTGLNRNTKYTVQAKYVGKNGYSDSEIAEVSATTAKTQLTAPTSLTISNITANSFAVQAPVITGGTLQFQLKLEGEVVYGWQNADANGRYTFNELTDGKIYTIEAKYVADEDYIDSAVRTDEAKTLTILGAPDLTATSTDVTITATAPAVTGGTLKFRINGGKWQDNGNFSGLKSNTQYTIEAMYEAEAGYVSSKITKITVTTQKGVPGTNGDYAYLEAIRESDVTAHVGYNRYSNHEMLSENLEQSALISDGMYGTIAKIMGAEAVSADKLADGYRLLSIVYDLNNGTTKLGAIEITGGDYNLTKFAIQVRNTKGVWQTVKFVTNDLFDISEALRNKTVLIPFTPVEGTQVRLLIDGYEANENNAPEIRELVIYEVKEDALQEKKAVTSADAPAVIDDNKATVYTGNAVTLSFNEATSVKRLKLFGNTESDSINGYTIKVQTAKGGEWTEVASGNAYSRAFNTSIVNLDKEYMAYGVQVIANGTAAIPEIEVYGYKDAPAYVDPTPATTPGATAPTEATRPPVVSPVQTSPAATEEFVMPEEPVWTETKPGNEPAWNETKPGNEGVWSDPVPDVPGESGPEPTAPTQAATQATAPQIRLDIIPQSQITPDVGTYTGANRTDWTSLTSYSTSEAALLINLNTNNKSYLYNKALSSNQVAAAVLSWTGTKTIGAVELAANPSDHATEFNIEYMDASGVWRETGVKVTSDPFTSKYTQLYTFDHVEAKAVRIVVFDDTGSNHFSFTEAYVYEVNAGTPLAQVPLTNASIDKSSNNGSNVAANMIDGDLQTGYDVHYNALPAKFTASVSSGANIPTTISRVEIHSLHPINNGSPKDVVISLYVDGAWVEVYNGRAYSSSSTDLFVCDLDQAYSATQIRVVFNSANYTNNAMAVAEIRAYGPDKNASAGSGSVGAVGTTTVETHSYGKLDLTGTGVGTCSKDHHVNDYDDFRDFKWYFDSSHGWTKNLVDGSTSNASSWGVTVGEERADFYVDLTKKYSSPVAIDRFIVRNGGGKNVKVKTIEVSLLLADDTIKTFTYTVNWAANGTEKLDITLDQTYNIKGVYVEAPDNNDSGSNSISYGEFELYGREVVQLEAPKNLQATETTANSITVDANKLSSASAGTLKFRINGGSWQTSGTFSGLTAGTTYTIDAMYDAGTGYVDSGISSIKVTTPVPVVTEFTVSGTTTAGTTVQLYKGGKLVDGREVVATNGSYTFENVAIGNYTLVITKSGHTTRMQQITVDKNLTVETITLVSAYNVSGTTTAGATVTLYQNGNVVDTVVATNGSYTFNNVTLGNYTLVFTKNGYFTKTAGITVSNANVTMNATLTATAISGTTTAGATVELYQNGNVVDTVVATNGSYAFNNVTLGNYTLVFSLTGYHTATASVTVSDANVTKDVTLVSARYTVSGTTTAGATVTLYQKGNVVQTVDADSNGNYSFSNVLIGNYALKVSKNGYISKAVTITVEANKTVDVITLSPVPTNSTNVVVDAVAARTYNVRLYEPWALRVNVTFYTEKNGTALNLSSFKSYGAYAVIGYKYGDGTTAPTSWEDIVNDPNAVQFKKADNEGNGNMFASSSTTATFDFYDGLYTYRLAESVYWVAYYEDANGIHFTEVMNPVLMDKVTNIIGKIAGDADQDTQRIVLEHMQQLHYALKDFRGEDAEFGNIYEPGVLNYNQNLGENTTGGTKYQFGRSHRIRLIEPWGIMINMQVRAGGVTYGEADFEAAQDYGLIFFHDKDSVYNGAMTRDQMLARNDVYIYSNDRGNAWLESWNTAGTPAITAAYDLDIFTYEMDSELYYMAFVVDAEGNYHYSNAYCLNIIDQMYAYYNNTTLKGEERLTFKAMIQLHESTLIHRKKYGK